MWNVGKLIEKSKLRCIFHQSPPNCIDFLSDAIVRAVRKHSLSRIWKFDISRSGPSAFRLEIRDSNSSFVGICNFCSKPISFEFLESSAIIIEIYTDSRFSLDSTVIVDSTDCRFSCDLQDHFACTLLHSS